MEDTQIIKTIADLGTSAILLYFIYELWKDKQVKDKDVKDTVREKDAHIEMINNKILEVVKDNTRVQSELTQAVRENTESNKTMTSQIYSLLTRK